MNSTKRCPYCGEEINIVAKKCKHCNEWLVKDRPAALPPTPQPQPEPEEETYDNSYSFWDNFDDWLPLIGYAVGAIVIGLILHFTIPHKIDMETAIKDDVYDCVQEEVASYSSLLGEDMEGLSSLFMSTQYSREMVEQAFDEENAIEVKRSWFWSVGKLHNRNTPSDGTTVCIGILGFTFSFVEWEDFVLSDEDE